MKIKETFFLKDFVYGSVDGIITTFAVVSGVVGAALPLTVILILGFANLFADGLSMSIGNYLSVKSEQELYYKERAREEEEIKKTPKSEVKDIERIFKKKGFKGDLLNKIINVITNNKKIWVDTMMCEEIGLIIDKVNPLKSAIVTFFSFIIMGFIPLITFIIGMFIPGFNESAFIISSIITLIALFSVGAIKGVIIKRKWFFSGSQTMIIGGLAAITSFIVGFLIKGIVN